MGSTFRDVGFNNLYIKGVLWQLADFIGDPGSDQSLSTKGPTGSSGLDDGFEFNTINTTATTVVINLPDPTTVSYDGIIVKSSGVLPMASEVSSNSLAVDLKLVRIKSHMNETVAMLYANAVPQTARFTKVFIPSVAENGDWGGYYSWNI